MDARTALCLELELICGVPGLQGADRGLRVHLVRGCEPVGGANFLTPLSVILSFYSAVDGEPREVLELEVQKLETSMAGPLGGCWRQVRQRPPSKLKTSMAPPWGC
jgi:hypothetical protein